MSYVTRAISGFGGRRFIFALGGLYVTLAVSWPFLPVVGSPSLGADIVLLVVAGGCGLLLLVSGYRLPRTDVRPELFAGIAKWCLGGIGVMLGVILLAVFAADPTNVAESVLILTALASVAGFGMGFNDARAKTRARNAEERRQEAERYSRQLERYETIVEAVNDGIFVADEEDRFVLVNEAYADMTGYDREELLGSHTEVVVREMDSSKAELRRDLTADTSESKMYEATLETPSGEPIEAEATIAGFPEQEGASHDFVGVVRDVTERNEREQRLKEQNERLDSFASMLAHELRNPVTIGQIYSDQLSAEADSDAVEHVTGAFDRIEDMIDVMLVLTRGSEAVDSGVTMDLAAVAEAAWEQVDAPEATLDARIDRAVQADETYMRHLFRNLFENAVEHAGTDVTVTVDELPTGFYVADDGCGIPADTRDAVFEAGYTTAADAEGTGLGLAFVEELVDVYGWTCTVTESATGGARFEFTDVPECEA